MNSIYHEMLRKHKIRNIKQRNLWDLILLVRYPLPKIYYMRFLILMFLVLKQCCRYLSLRYCCCLRHTSCRSYLNIIGFCFFNVSMTVLVLLCNLLICTLINTVCGWSFLFICDFINRPYPIFFRKTLAYEEGQVKGRSRTILP